MKACWRGGTAGAPNVDGERSPAGAWAAELDRVHLLSEREEQVFILLGDGHSNRSISARLRVTERTVKAHVAQILEKLRVESRLQAGLVSYAHQILNESPIPCQRQVG
ncbi:response regulator transcription factor [Streptomyces olivaceiscleroticus]|uniref:HTH luxR-type domain-containing protein n=1 Tax=Streptomyces olivaceiscleroticus TaxID=68245 RepID=A0ABN1B6H5_9ACTN